MSVIPCGFRFNSVNSEFTGVSMVIATWGLSMVMIISGLGHDIRGAFPLYRFSQCLRSIFLMRSNALLPQGVIISSTTSTQSQVNYAGAAILAHNCNFLHVPVICPLKWNLCCYHFSAANIEPTISWQGSFHAILLNKL